MGNKVKFKEKKKLDNSDSLCCWCYELSFDSDLGKDVSVGLDFPASIDIKDPANYKDCAGYQRGELKDSAGKRTHWLPFKKLDRDLDRDNPTELCFIAPCKENAKTTVSLEIKGLQSGASFKEEAFDGDKEILGPTAAAPAESDDSVALLARYEGIKLRYLFSPALFSPPPQLCFTPVSPEADRPTPVEVREEPEVLREKKPGKKRPTRRGRK